jgi:hypothetical protein
MGQTKNTYNILVGKSEWKRPHGRRIQRKWEDNIRMDLKHIVRKGVNWVYLIKDRDQWRAVLYRIMNIRVSYKANNFLTG